VVQPLAVDAERLPGSLDLDLDTVGVLDARVALVPQLDLHLDDPIEEPFNTRQLLCRVLA
jgi:hypothetical protein